MRKRIINFLYNRKFLSWLLPVFNRFIGKNRICAKKGNTICIANAFPYKTHISFGGHKGNTVQLGRSDLHNADIRFKGQGNTLIIGDDCYLNGLKLIFEGNNNSIEIGNGVFILDDTRIYVVDGSSVTIGDGCMFSDHIEIRTTDNHSIYDRTTGIRINHEKNIVLGKFVWLGMHTIVLKGTHLAEGTIVGAGSLVSGRHDISHSVIAGNPAKLLRQNVVWTMERHKQITPKL